jgi:hypothetical protein
MPADTVNPSATAAVAVWLVLFGLFFFISLRGRAEIDAQEWFGVWRGAPRWVRRVFGDTNGSIACHRLVVQIMGLLCVGYGLAALASRAPAGSVVYIKWFGWAMLTAILGSAILAGLWLIHRFRR